MSEDADAVETPAVPKGTKKTLALVASIAAVVGGLASSYARTGPDVVTPTLETRLENIENQLGDIRASLLSLKLTLAAKQDR